MSNWIKRKAFLWKFHWKRKEKREREDFTKLSQMRLSEIELRKAIVPNDVKAHYENCLSQSTPPSLSLSDCQSIKICRAYAQYFSAYKTSHSPSPTIKQSANFLSLLKRKITRKIIKISDFFFLHSGITFLAAAHRHSHVSSFQWFKHSWETN
jgi:hypothetical protein